MSTDRALPPGWTICVHPGGPLTVLTLRTNDGSPQTTDYHGPTTGPAQTVHSLDEIPDEALRSTAQRLINKHFHQLEQTSATATVPQQALPDTDDPAPASFPLLVGAQVGAYALEVRRQICDHLAAILRDGGQALAANLVEEDRDFTEISRSLTVIPDAPKTEHGAYCRPFDCRCDCDRAQSCLNCHRCVCWRVQCCAQVAVDRARTRARKTALRRLLNGVGLAMLTELRETVAEAEEDALRDTIASRVRLLALADGRPYSRVVFAARDSKLGMGHADYRVHDVELYDDELGQDDGPEDEQDGPAETVDLDDDVLSAALGTLAGLLHPDEGADLTVYLTE
ncbi:hypothetical protein [Streptomyces sp. NPDC102476]|uniref:hypothetical protein n=1 Tax=Streptomyces sp. NPDC102476 TaxID=3366181 RepID=UPI0037F76F30